MVFHGVSLRCFMLFHCCFMLFHGVSLRCFMLFHYCFFAVSLLFHAVSVSQYFAALFHAVSLLFHCCFIAVSLLFHCCFMRFLFHGVSLLSFMVFQGV